MVNIISSCNQIKVNQDLLAFHSLFKTNIIFGNWRFLLILRLFKDALFSFG